MSSTFLSKSKYLDGLQCHKLLWYDYNAKAMIPAPDAATQFKFDQGHEVGELAKKLFPGGIDVAKGIYEFPTVIKKSLEAVKLRKPLFEAGFLSNSGYARADILNPVGQDQWDIVEVKSSTEVKPPNLHDLAFQRYVYRGAGLKIRDCYLIYINNKYVRRGEVDPRGIFTQEDVTDQVAALLPTVADNISGMLKTIALKKEPDIPIGLQCDDPYDCPLMDHCWKFLPENSVFTLYLIRRAKAFDLLRSGVMNISRLPRSVELSDVQKIQVESVITGKPHLDKCGLAAFLASLEYPLYFLDFETFDTAIPLYDLVHPYEKVPFQYSLHIQKSAGAKPEHYSHLADGQSDPRPEILSKLRSLMGSRGSVVAYNAPFEKTVLTKCCEAYPEYSEWYHALEKRIIDLRDPFRAFYYYHPDQQGSASLKQVFPALTGQGYEGLEISDGTQASLEYLRVTFGQSNVAERKTVRKQLEEYCHLDTLAMVKIVQRIRDLSR